MGVTISSKRYDADMGYGGFFRFRIKVAESVNDKVGDHYKKLTGTPLFLNEIESSEYWDKYDRNTKKLIDDGILTLEVADFLYQSDCEGEINRKQAKLIYEIIKNEDDNIIFGYIGRSDCAKMSDMKKIFNDKTKVKWR